MANEKTWMELIGIDKRTGNVLLSLLDSGGWEKERDHLDALQDKVYRYLDSIEQGELARLYPRARGRKAEIRVRFTGALPPAASELMAALVEEAAEVGVRLAWEVI